LLAVVLLAFLATPILHLGDSYYSSADAGETSSLTMLDVDHPPLNRLLGDPALQMHPWSMFNRDELHAGRVPLWNPYNGTGSPHLANYQSAVFSPFSIPFYVLGFRVALIASAFLKLFASGAFAFLFLRALRLAWWPSMVGATAYMLCAQNIVMLAYPHSGAMIALPAGLYFAESACAGLVSAPGERAPEPRSRRWALAGLAASLGAGLLAGAPETFWYGLFFVIAYVTARFIGAYRALRDPRIALPRIARLAFAFVVAGMLALGLAAVQVLPFFEYLAHSAVVVDAARSWSSTIRADTWPLVFFPDLLGNPTDTWSMNLDVPPPNFSGAVSVYTGAAVLLLAVISIRWVRRRHAHAFFAAATVLWALWVYDAFGWAHLRVLSPLALAPVNHSYHVGVFGICVCASFALHHIDSDRARLSARRIAVLGAIALAFLTLCWWGADAYGPKRYPELQLGAEAGAAVRRENVALSALFGLAWTIVVLLPSIRAERARTCAWVALLVLVILPCGWLLRAYNPTLPERYFYPHTRAITALQDAVGDERVVVIGTDTIAPDVNLPHRLRMLTSYDALMIDAYARLYRMMFGSGYGLRPSLRATPAAMRTFGAPFVLAPPEWNPVTSHFAGVDWFTKSAFVLGEIRPDAPAAQRFTVTRDRLRSVVLHVLTRRRVNRCAFQVRLTDVASAAIVAEREFACEEWGVPPDGDRDVVLSFDPIADSRGRRYELSIRSPDARPGSAISLWANRDHRAIEERAARRRGEPPASELAVGAATYAGADVDGGLAYDWSFDGDGFRPVTRVGPFELYRDERARSRYHVVDRMVHADSPGRALELVRDADFDPTELVVISDDDVAAPEPRVDASSRDDAGGSMDGSVRVISEEPCRVELELAGDRPGFLVLAIPWYPGWTAVVDGRRSRLLRANYAFQALALDAGAKSVVLEYAPRSFRWGAWISALSLLVGVGLVLASQPSAEDRRRPGRNVRASPAEP
jgi:hypothetical protein